MVEQSLVLEKALEVEVRERRRAEAQVLDANRALRLAEERIWHLAAIVESSEDAIISKTLAGTIMSWNAGAQRMFGYTPEEAIGQSITFLFPPDRVNEEPAIVERICRGERIDHYETVRRRKDGSDIEISLSISPVRDADGRITGAAKIARDITDRRRAERTLAQARDDLARVNQDLEKRVSERTASLREAVAQMEEFSYTVSHDLRAPLRGMQVYSGALLEDYSSTLPPEARHCLERIADNAARLDRMVSDVLTFSRVSRNELTLQRVDLDRLVRDLIGQYPGLQPPRAEIVVETLPEVIAHEPSLSQVLSNLLANAVKFVAPEVKPRVRVWAEPQGAGIRLWVEDNGIGIDPRHQHRLFRMFERLNPHQGYEGTGVGLAIVRKAARRMGGDVGAVSDGRSGSRFWLQLPKAGAA